jgi:hypothetical protein
MARYGKAVQKSVKSAMDRRKHGTLKSGRRGKRHRKKPQTSDCDWTFRSSQEGHQGTEQQIQLIPVAADPDRNDGSLVQNANETWQFELKVPLLSRSRHKNLEGGTGNGCSPCQTQSQETKGHIQKKRRRRSTRHFRNKLQRTERQQASSQAGGNLRRHVHTGLGS